jgi:putative Ca2+/H+ antiporter (TMEM165/GDT1 family)
MDWKALFSTFAVVFLAELGDKTQLATFALTASGRSRSAVLIGSASALVVTSVLAVVAGAALGKVIPPIWLRRGAGALMLALGALLLLQRGS